MPPAPPAPTYLSPLDRAFERLGGVLAPIVPRGLTPNAITLIGITGGLTAAAALFLAAQTPAFFALAVLGIAVHILADSVDGPVARLRGRSSRLGAYLDQMGDNVAFTAMPLALGLSGQVRMEIIAFIVLLVLLHAVQQYNWVLHTGRKVAPRFGTIDYELSYVATILLAVLWPGRVATLNGNDLNWFELAFAAGAAWSVADLCFSVARLGRELRNKPEAEGSPAMTLGAAAGIAPPQPDEEANRYQRHSILRSERMYGYGFQGPGREALVAEFCARVPADLTAARILDVGSGLGGSSFYLNGRFDARVTALDIAPDMTAISRERAAARGVTGIDFVNGDIRDKPLEADAFDLVWSRDCILYIPEKRQVWRQIVRCLKPGGHLFVTDFCRPAGPFTPDYAVYHDQCRYYTRDLGAYAAELTAAGLDILATEDITPRFQDYLARELAGLEADRDAFLWDWSEDDYAYLVNRWKKKQKFCADGDLRWGLFLARKP